MSVGFIMLVHNGLERAAQVARHLTAAGCPVVIHIDAHVPEAAADRFRGILRREDLVRFAPQSHCEWGTWSIVEATQTAARQMLGDFPDVGHVALISGACLPIKPLRKMSRYLTAHPDTDFIESVETGSARWTRDGLEEERFRYFFPVSWKKHRRLFDMLVAAQRRLKIRRKVPDDLNLHLGSQWWCLTRTTLSAILNDPRSDEHQAFFSKTWIPDEGYFQTLARKHSQTIEARSLTLTKFDTRGRPYIFYDDHLELLRRSDCFMARKVWPRADRLYQSFLAPVSPVDASSEPAKLDNFLKDSEVLAASGRTGLVSQGRFPHHGGGIETAAPYAVLQGYDKVVDGFQMWLGRQIAGPVHGRIFHPDRVDFFATADFAAGGLASNPYLRDYDRAAFLRNLVWNTRGQRQVFQYAPADGLKPWRMIARDQNASFSVIGGAWVLDLLGGEDDFETIRDKAIRLQKLETGQLQVLSRHASRTRVRITPLTDVFDYPGEALRNALSACGVAGSRDLGELPGLAAAQPVLDLLRKLRNSGVPIQHAGHLPLIEPALEEPVVHTPRIIRQAS